MQTCTLLTANLPSSVGYLYKFATRTTPDEASTRRSVEQAVDTAALMRESALKSSIFVGVPRVRDHRRNCRASPSYFVQTILSLGGMMEAFEDDVKDRLRKESKRHVYRYSFVSPSPDSNCRSANRDNVEEIVARGRGLWQSIYTPQDVKLYNKLGGLHPDFIGVCRQCY